MNDVTVKIPDGLERTCQVEIEAGDTLDNTTSFESAIARLQERLDAERSDARADSRAICVAATRKDKGAESSQPRLVRPSRRTSVLLLRMALHRVPALTSSPRTVPPSP